MKPGLVLIPFILLSLRAYAAPCKELSLPKGEKCQFVDDALGGHLKCGNYTGDEIKCHGNGTVSSKGSYKDGIPHGPSISFHTNGKMKSKLFNDRGHLKGEATKWFEDGSIKSKKEYVDGRLRTATEFYKSGVKKQSVECDADGRCKNVSFHENGSIYRTYSTSPSGRMDGTVSEYDENGVKKYEHEFKDGERIKIKSKQYR